ncbi:MAG: transcription termination/antitermination NusG family protein [Verrucomicrobiota bacterium]|nr:transcription termination/antitermination NusG family protein [Verrucomicrobiota bacterium]
MPLDITELPKNWRRCLSGPQDEGGDSTQLKPFWCVAHVKPRCEKKLAKYCEDWKVDYILPLYKSLKTYPTKRVVFYKPYFPGYIFINTPLENHQMLKKSQHLARLIQVVDQELFAKQLVSVLLAITSDAELLPASKIKPGILVRIKRGVLRGVEGLVEERRGVCRVCLSLDFIGQGVIMEVDADDLEVV